MKTPDTLIEAVIAAVRLQPVGTIIRIDSGDPSVPAVGFGTKVSLQGPIQPGFSGFIGSRGFDCLRSINAAGDKNCTVYVERDGLLKRLAQFSFTQTHAEVIVCVTGDEACRRAIEVLLDAVDEWRDGKHRLFDGDGFMRDDSQDVTVHVDEPKVREGRTLRWIERIGGVITILYTLWHLMHL